jgi:hypothetical protein
MRRNLCVVGFWVTVSIGPHKLVRGWTVKLCHYRGDGTLQGDVSADGKLTMRSNLAGLFQGQIEANGVIKGYYQGYCIYDLIWQRR